MNTDCYCDADLPHRRYLAIRQVAKKRYVCDECGVAILPNDRFEWSRGKWNTRWSLVRTCAFCLAQRDMIETRANCFCWLHGTLRENMADFLTEEGYKYPGLTFGLLSIELERRNAR